MRKVINIMTTVILILVIIFALLLVGVRFFGLEPYTVLSGSMEPEYHVGSLIYVKKTSAAELTVGMPITYRLESGVVVTHRIVEVLVDEDNPTLVSYRVKGDVNDDPDGTPVPIANVIGRPIFTIPVIGYVCYFIQHPPGSFITVAALMIFVILAFVPDLFAMFAQDSKVKAKSDREKEKEELERELERLKSFVKDDSEGKR